MDSRWTFTVAAWKLRRAGSGPDRIRDFRRAVNGWRVYATRSRMIRQAFANALTLSDSMVSENVIKGGSSRRDVSEGARVRTAATRRRRHVAERGLRAFFDTPTPLLFDRARPPVELVGDFEHAGGIGRWRVPAGAHT